MAVDSLVRVTENGSGTKWYSSKDAAMFGSPLKDMASEELDLITNECRFQRHQAELVLNRSSSAPPRMESSFAAVRNHPIKQTSSANSSLDDVRITLEYSKEQLPSDPACLLLNHHPMQSVNSVRKDQRFTSVDESGYESLDFSGGSLSSHKEETEECSPPLRASQDLEENSVAEASRKNTIFSASCHNSLVELIQVDTQEDFPRTTSPVYSSSGHTKTNELADYDVNAISLNSHSVNKAPEPKLCSINCPETSSLDPCSSEMIPSDVPLSTSSLHLDETRKPLKDESGDKYVNLGYSSGLETRRVNSRTSLEIKRNHEKQQSYRKNVPRLCLSMQEDIQYQEQRFQCQTISQGMPQLPGITSPLYAEQLAYTALGNHFLPNLQPSSIYAQQYILPGYVPGSALSPPFMASYPSHSLPPFLSSPSYVGITTDVTMREGMPHICDMQQQSKFYGQHGSMPQPFLVNHLHMQYYPHPSQQVYGSLAQHAQLATSIESTSSAYMGDHMFHLPPNGSLNVTPSSHVGGGNYTDQQSEMRLHSGLQGKRGFNATDEPKKLSSFEEFNSSNYQKLELSNIEGRIVEFSMDQQGSRFIQQKLEHCSAEKKMSVFNEVIPHASRLMVDVFANYVIQKLFELGSAEQKKKLADKLSGQMLSLSLQMYGCRVIQKALEVIELDQKSPLVKELDGHIMQCVTDQNGNHVIQKCIEILPTEDIGFIISSFKGQVPKLASHPYGCRVIQRVLEQCLVDIQCQCIVDEILESACSLAQNQYGNYVIQHILERGKPHERSQIISKLDGRFVQMSQHKYASNVVEKCLEYGNTTEQEHLIEEILEHSGENDILLAMMKDQYANYVVQKMFKMSNDRQREILLDRTRVHLHALRKYTYGKHIAACFEP